MKKPAATGAGRTTWRAQLTADAATGRRLADLLSEHLDADEVAISAFEIDEKSWQVAIDFADPPDQRALRELVGRLSNGKVAGTLAFARVAEQDWIAKSLAGLKPVEAGRFLVHGAHDRKHVGASRIGIEIEASLAFGTGHHGTTRGCLLALDALTRRRKFTRVLDLGTGTGVLAIAAAKRMRTKVLATDIDRRSVSVARENAQANHAGNFIDVMLAGGLSAHGIKLRAPFDLVLANILLSPLRRLAAPMARLVAPGGRVVLSGLLASQGAAALAAYRAQGLALERRIPLEGWVTLILRRGR